MPVPVLTVQQMREWEKATWDTGVREANVITRVGRIVAARALALTRAADEILILAGKGHNGDDARQALGHLANRRAKLLNVVDPEAALPEFRASLAARPALVVDALFGIGLNRALSASWINLIKQLNQARLPILAVDVPSGLNADTGQPEGAAVEARWTLTLGAPKVGLLTPAAQRFVGRLEVEPEIGLIDGPRSGESYWTLGEDFRDFPPPRPVEGHKGSFGHLIIIAGSLGYHGAAVLCSHAALRAKPGLVTVLCPEDVYFPVAAQSQAAMIHPWRSGVKLPGTCSAVLFGPGLAAGNLSQDIKAETKYLSTS